MKIIFFDTETTGLDFKESRIIELAMLIVEDGKIEEYDE
ncbi:exonuclease domain-containing protein, partial [Methanobrevibacter sp.]